MKTQIGMVAYVGKMLTLGEKMNLRKDPPLVYYWEPNIWRMLL